MKKLLALIAGIMFLAGSSLMAENISFSYGTNFFSPSVSGFATSNGQSTVLEWKLDTGLTLGVVNEQTVLDYNDSLGTSVIGNFTLKGIRITQNVIERVNLGLGIGSATANLGAGAETSPVVDVIGDVIIFSGSGDRVEGSLNAFVAARYMNTAGLTTAAPAGDGISDLNGTNIGLAVKLGF